MSTQSLAKTEPGQQLAVRVGNIPLAEIVEKQLWKSDELAKVANVTFPVTALDHLPPNHAPSLSVIRVDPNPASKDTYNVSGQKALSKHVLLKMANAGGLHIRTRKISPRHDLDFIEWEAVAMGRLPDGTPISVKCSKSWSWAKCQEEMSEKQAKEYRKFADEQTETKAILRAVRAAMNLKTSYTPEEIAKPFLIARSVFSPDMSDPEVRRMVTREQLRSQGMLYPGGQQDQDDLASLPEPTELPEEDEEERDYIDATAADVADDEDYDPFKVDEPKEDTAFDPAAEAAALEEKIAALAKRASEGGIGQKMALVLQKYGVRTWQGGSLDLLQSIHDDALAVKEGRMQI